MFRRHGLPRNSSTGDRQTASTCEALASSGRSAGPELGPACSKLHGEGKSSAFMRVVFSHEAQSFLSRSIVRGSGLSRFEVASRRFARRSVMRKR